MSEDHVLGAELQLPEISNDNMNSVKGIARPCGRTDATDVSLLETVVAYIVGNGVTASVMLLDQLLADNQWNVLGDAVSSRYSESNRAEYHGSPMHQTDILDP